MASLMACRWAGAQQRTRHCEQDDARGQQGPGHRCQHVPQGLGHQRQKPLVRYVGYTPILYAVRSSSRLNDNVG